MTAAKRNDVLNYGPLGRGQVDSSQIDRYRDYDMVMKDGSTKPHFFKANHQCWLRRDREKDENLEVKPILRQMERLCAYAKVAARFLGHWVLHEASDDGPYGRAYTSVRQRTCPFHCATAP